MCFPIECHFDVYRLLEGRLPSFIDGRIFFNPEHLFRIGATRKTRKNEEKKTFPNHGIFPMDSPYNLLEKSLQLSKTISGFTFFMERLSSSIKVNFVLIRLQSIASTNSFQIQ